MARVKVQIPDSKPVFETSLEITIDQINYGGHLGNDKYLAIMHEARLRWFKSLGYKDEISVSEGLGVFVVDIACEFLGEVFHGDKVLIQLFISDQHKYGFDLVVQFFVNGDNVFRGKTGMMSVDLERRKATTFPSEFFEKAMPN